MKLAKQLKPEFLADVSIRLDPARSRAIVSALPPKFVIDVGHRLLNRGEFLTLGRFVSEVDAEVALAVVEAADGFQLLQIGVYAEDAEKLNTIVGLLPDERLAQPRRAVTSAEPDPVRSAQPGG